MNGVNSLVRGSLVNQSGTTLTQPEVVQVVQAARCANQPCAVQARTCCTLPEEARKPDTSVLQHAAEQLWSKLKVDAASATGLGSSLVACSSNGLTTTTDASCQPRTILANLLIITAGKSIFPPDHSTMLANSAGSTFPIKFGLLTQSSSTPSKTLEGTGMRATDIEISALGDAAGGDCGSSPMTSGAGALVALSTSGSAPLSSYSSSSPLLSSQLSSVSLSPSSSSSPPESAPLLQFEPTAEVTEIKLGSMEPTVPTVNSSAVKTEAVGPVVYRGPEIKSEPKDHSADSPRSGDSQPAPARTGQYTCFTCRQHFQSHTGLKRHNLALHVTQILPCDQCVKVFRHPNALADHKKRVHGPREYVCGVCSADFATESYLRTHVRIHEEKQFCCAECKHCFSNHTDLKNHMRVHNGEKPFTCEVCGKSFRHVSGFYAHIRIHTGETPYNCEQCDKKFSNASNYRMHMKVHTKEMRFRCETCGKEFIQPSNYSRHLRIHTKERPYACNLCSAQFPYSTSLKRHQQRDHGVNLLSCRVCSKTFLNETSLVRHRTGCELRACVTTTGAELCAQLL